MGRHTVPCLLDLGTQCASHRQLRSTQRLGSQPLVDSELDPWGHVCRARSQGYTVS